MLEDWVSISKKYAMDHGRDNLGGNFKIISKQYPQNIYIPMVIVLQSEVQSEEKSKLLFLNFV